MRNLGLMGSGVARDMTFSGWAWPRGSTPGAALLPGVRDGQRRVTARGCSVQMEAGVGWDALEQNYRWWGHCRESEGGERQASSGTAPVWGHVFFGCAPLYRDLSS